MNKTANAAPDSSFLVPAADDAHDQAYRFGKPLSYLSDRQQVRLFIVRSRIHEARTTDSSAS